MEETKRCPYCGEEILATAKKCKYCGEWLDGSPPRSNPKKLKLNWKWMTLLSVVIVLIVCVFSCFRKKPEDKIKQQLSEYMRTQQGESASISELHIDSIGEFSTKIFKEQLKKEKKSVDSLNEVLASAFKKFFSDVKNGYFLYAYNDLDCSAMMKRITIETDNLPINAQIDEAEKNYAEIMSVKDTLVYKLRLDCIINKDGNNIDKKYYAIVNKDNNTFSFGESEGNSYGSELRIVVNQVDKLKHSFEDREKAERATLKAIDDLYKYYGKYRH